MTKHEKVELHEKYDENGETDSEKCPKCGRFLAQHDDRKSCGKCGYTKYQ